MPTRRVQIIALPRVFNLPKRHAMEADKLDFAWNPDPVLSRLTWQIKVSAALDRLRVQMPEKQI